MEVKWFSQPSFHQIREWRTEFQEEPDVVQQKCEK